MGSGNDGTEMNPRGPEIIMILGAFGAMIGAVSAVVAYTLCVRRRRISLNWFEKDLLDRAEEAEKTSKKQHALEKLQPRCLGGIIGKQNSKNGFNSGGAPPLSPRFTQNDQWEQSSTHDGIFNNRVMKTRDVNRHLSECSCDSEAALATSPSPMAPPLPGPGGAVIASDERMVILRSLPLASCSSQNGSDTSSLHAGRLSSTDSDDISCPRSANETRGELQICLTYDAPNGLLTVKLIEAHGLRARDLSETADPYAKIRLLPDRTTVKQTRIHKQTLNPEFDEEFVFQVVPNCSLAERTLEVLLYDFDASSKHRAMGYVQLPMSTVPDLGTEARTVTKSVLRYGAFEGGRFPRGVPNLGELMVSLSYQPSSEKLTVIVIRARNLSLVSDELQLTTSTAAATSSKVKSTDSTFEPFVLVNVIGCDGKSLKKKKTSVRCSKDDVGASPVWSETLSFDIPIDVLALSRLDFSIFRSNGGELLARCEVSESCQRELFNRVLAGAGASAQWLPLSEPYHDDAQKILHQQQEAADST